MKSKLFKALIPFLVQPDAHQLLHDQVFTIQMNDMQDYDFQGPMSWYKDLLMFSSVDPVGAQWRTIGFIPPLGAFKEDAPLIEGFGGRAYIMYVQFNEKILPGSVRDEHMQAKIKELEDKEGRPLSKGEYCQVRDVVELELLKGAYIRRSVVPVMITDSGYMFVFSGSAKKVDDAGALVRRAIPFLRTRPVDTDLGTGAFLRTVMADPLYWKDSLDYDDDTIPGYGVEAFNAAKLHGTDKKTVTLKDVDIYSQDVQNIRLEGYEPIELRMSYFESSDAAESSQPQLTFTLTEKTVFKGITVGEFDADGDAGAERDDSAMAMITADWLLVAALYSDVVSAFVAVNGGARKGLEFLEPQAPANDVTEGTDDEYYERAVKKVTESNKASISYLQRVLQVGYNRAARLIERMEEEGVISGISHDGSRTVIGNTATQDDEI